MGPDPTNTVVLLFSEKASGRSIHTAGHLSKKKRTCTQLNGQNRMIKVSFFYHSNIEISKQRWPVHKPEGLRDVATKKLTWSNPRKILINHTLKKIPKKMGVTMRMIFKCRCIYNHHHQIWLEIGVNQPSHIGVSFNWTTRVPVFHFSNLK